MKLRWPFDARAAGISGAYLLNMSVSVAIVQNKLGIDGRSRVVVELIELLNKRGISPDVFVLIGKDLLQTLSNAFGKNKLDFRPCAVWAVRTLKGGTLPQQNLLNLLTRSTLRQYDVVINSNNTLAWLPVGPRYIHYIHVPPKAAMAYGRTIRQPLLWSLYSLPLRLLERLGPVHFDNATFLTNSEYTARLISDAYELSESDIVVIYPPTTQVDLSLLTRSSKERKGVVSLGNFGPHKRQLEQLQIASEIPDMKFTIIGGVANQSYFFQCQQFVLKYNIQNARLLPNVPHHVVREALSSALFFLHTKRFEPFGIATVEAISSGCVPLVHDSGGQREIVPILSLRFQDKDDAVARLKCLQAAPLDMMQKQLLAHIRQFSAEAFQKRMQDILDVVLC